MPRGRAMFAPFVSCSSSATRRVRCLARPRNHGWLACTPANLTPDFRALVHAAGPGAHFVGGRADEENRCHVQVRTTAGATEEHLIGRFVRVGNALRLIEPASGPFAIAAS